MESGRKEEDVLDRLLIKGIGKSAKTSVWYVSCCYDNQCDCHLFAYCFVCDEKAIWHRSIAFENQYKMLQWLPPLDALWHVTCDMWMIYKILRPKSLLYNNYSISPLSVCIGPEYEKMKKSAQKLSTVESQKSLQSAVFSSGQTLPPKYDNYIHYTKNIMCKPL